MSQKLSPFLNSKYGWNFGESGWNLGMDENILKFSYMAARLIDGIVDTLPAQSSNGNAYFLSTDNSVYFRVDNQWQSLVLPKWATLSIRGTGERYIFDGVNLLPIKSNLEVSQDIQFIQEKVDTLGSAAFENASDFAPSNSSYTPVTVFGPVGTPDDTETVQAAINSGVKNLVIPSNTTVTLGTVTIPTSITIVGMDATSVLRRKNNYELDNSSAGGSTATMLDITAHNIRVRLQNLCLDGNESNQNVNTPSGAMIRAYNLMGTTSDVLDIRILGCTMVNQTRSSILVKGNVASTGQEVLTVTDTLFINGRAGVGAGDPRSANPSGFAPYYINVNDKFRVVVQGNSFIFAKSLSSSAPLDYAPGAIRFTRVDATTNDQGSSGIVQGNYFYRCGRSDRGYDGAANSNNGLGAVEAYTIGRDIVVSGNRFVGSLSSCVRAKCSVDSLIVTGNSMRDCIETGISVGPMLDSAGTQTGRIVVSGNVLRGADINGITVVGDSAKTPDHIGEIIISNNIVSGVTNATGSSGGNEAGITLRQARRAIVSGNTVSECNANSGVAGIRARLCTDVTIADNRVDGVSSFGIYAQSCEGAMSITGNAIQSSADSGIAASQGASADFTINGNSIGSAVNSGISVMSGRYVVVSGNAMLNITGGSRGLLLDPSLIFSSIQGNVTNATTPLFHTINSNVTQAGNSWNPTVQHRTAPPTTGTWKVGDRVENPAPLAGGFIGWVCTVAGTPGTWKGYGTIAA